MALTINPAVCGGNRRFVDHTLAFWAGAVLGGLATATTVLAASQLAQLVVGPDTVAILGVGLIGVVVARDVGFPVPVPNRDEQVPEWIRGAMPLEAVAATYGFMLGTGVATKFTSSAVLATWILAPYVGGLAWVVGIAATAGLGRVIVILAGAQTADSNGAAADEPFRSAIGHRPALTLATVSASSLAAFLILHQTGLIGR
jgi:hypothetical protein